MKIFWRNNNAQYVIDTISREEAKVCTVVNRKSLKNFCLDFSYYSEFDAENELLYSRPYIVNMARTIRFNDGDKTHVDELLHSYSSEITNENLLQMENNRENDKKSERMPSRTFLYDN